MMSEIPVNIYFEDSLSGAVLRKLLDYTDRNYSIGVSHNTGGRGWIKKRVRVFNQAAQGMPYLILIDLDRHECAPVLLDQWLGDTKHHNLILRIAVREVESWLLAGRNSLAEYIGVPGDKITAQVEQLDNPKEYLIDLVRKTRKRKLKKDIIPQKGSKVGPDYHGRLTDFVIRYWNPAEARKHSPSLDRALTALEQFQPVFWDR